MLNFFDTIIEYFSVVGDLLVSMVEAFLTAIGVIATATVLPQYISPWVPPFLASSVICVVAFAVVKFILGR